MQASESAIRQVVQEVLAQLGKSTHFAPPRSGADGDWGVFKTVDGAVEAANDAFKQLTEAGIEARRKAIDCVRKITETQAEELGKYRGYIPADLTSAGHRDNGIKPGTSPALAAALTNPVPVGEVPLRAWAAPFKGSGKIASVAIAVELDGSALNYEQRDGRF